MKPTFHDSLIRFAAAWAILAGFFVQGLTAQSGLDETRALQITKVVHPVYPHGLRAKGVTEGDVTVVFSVDAEGQLEDVMPIAYSHVEFYTVTAATMKNWTFEPALNQGRPHPVVQFITLTFEAGHDVVSMSAADASVSWLHSSGHLKDNYHVATLPELDAIPTPINVVSPGYPEAYLGSGREGHVTIEFYIDENGRTRMPAIIDHNGLEFGASSVDAVSQWTFEPPKRNGRHVAVMVKQKFRFAAPEGNR
jgi:TonB family protein